MASSNVRLCRDRSLFKVAIQGCRGAQLACSNRSDGHLSESSWRQLSRPFWPSGACNLSTGLHVQVSSSPPRRRRSVPRSVRFWHSLRSTRRHLRSLGQGDLVVPRTRTAGFGPRSFPVAGPLAWNSLPPEIKTRSLTLGQFSGRLKSD